MVLMITDRLLSLVTEEPLILLQWIYATHFVKLSAVLVRPLKPLEKASVFFLLGVLTINSLNSTFLNGCQIYIRLTNFNAGSYEMASIIWTVYSQFFYDNLILINGISFLMLFSHISKNYSVRQ